MIPEPREKNLRLLFPQRSTESPEMFRFAQHDKENVSRRMQNCHGRLALAGHSQRAFPFKQRRMRVIKAAVERVRCEIAEVFLAQFPQRLNQ